jgi:FixJ family two-component response regulator
MTPHSILPFFHPSTVVFVDDNERFLNSFTMLLSENLAYRCFSSTSAALSFVNDRASMVPLDQRCFSFLGQQHRAGGTLRLDLALIEQEISNPDRFQDISVVVVDYDMPEMNGLELCQSIRNRRIKKVLLTGVGDEKVAVRAFNDGLIDRFLTKSDPDIAQKINQTIRELQKRYFADISSMIQNTLEMKSPDFVRDQHFIDTFYELKKQRNIAEYYYVEDPNGFLMVTHTGKLYRLVVYSDTQADEQIFAIRKFNPPADIVNRLKNRQSLIWLWTSPDEDVDEPDNFDWHEFLHPAKKIVGNKTWYYAMVDNPPADIEYDEEQASYASYLAKLDAAV